MKLNVIHSLVFGFLSAGSLNAMEKSSEEQIVDAKKYEKYAEEHLVKKIMILGSHIPSPISEEAQEWASRCKKYADTPLPSTPDADLITRIRDCLNPKRTVAYKTTFKTAFKVLLPHNSLSHATDKLMSMYIEGVEGDIKAIETELKRREAEAANVMSDASTTE